MRLRLGMTGLLDEAARFLDEAAELLSEADRPLHAMAGVLHGMARVLRGMVEGRCPMERWVWLALFPPYSLASPVDGKAISATPPSCNDYHAVPILPRVNNRSGAKNASRVRPLDLQLCRSTLYT